MTNPIAREPDEATNPQTDEIERVARIIDPEAWNARDKMRADCVPRPNRLCDRLAFSESAAIRVIAALTNTQAVLEGDDRDDK